MRDHNIDGLLNIMRQLRDPDSGCPWDVEQDFHSIAPYTIEEAYEVADAIERKDWSDLRDELGDLLLQVVFHAQMADENGLFSFVDVVDSIHRKMIRRHPHVFGEAVVSDAAEQTDAWERIKSEERKERASKHNTSVLGEIPKALPALEVADKLQSRAARVGFDWPDAHPVYEKLAEEVEELQEAQVEGDPQRIEEEFGDLLFACVNLGRKLGLNSSQALQKANAKFRARFEQMEEFARQRHTSLEDLSLDQLEVEWQKAKKIVTRA